MYTKLIIYNILYSSYNYYKEFEQKKRWWKKFYKNFESGSCSVIFL